MTANESAFKAAEMGNTGTAALLLGMGLVSSIGLIPILVVLGIVGALTVVFLPLVIWGGTTLIITAIAWLIGVEPKYAMLAGIGTGFLSFIGVQYLGVSILSASGMAAEATMISGLPAWAIIVSLIVGGLSWLKIYSTMR